MRWSQLGIVAAITLTAPMSAVQGQHLPPWFTPSRPVLFFTDAEPMTMAVAPLLPSNACRISPVLVVVFEMAGGAVAGLIAYELTGGILIAAEGASSKPFARDLRYSLMAAGAVFGAVRGFVATRNCHTASAGA